MILMQPPVVAAAAADGQPEEEKAVRILNGDGQLEIIIINLRSSIDLATDEMWCGRGVYLAREREGGTKWQWVGG